MRVIAGAWKGRKLKSPVGDAVRPTTDRVKEALFNILGPHLEDGLFVDLCCGAGGLGIEALSRGAGEVIFVDLARKSLDLARNNLEICGAEAARYQLVKSDAATWLDRWRPKPAPGPLVLVADPPYQSPTAGAIMRALDRWPCDREFEVAVVEHGQRTPDLPGPAEVVREWSTRRYGESCLAVVRALRETPGEGD